MVCVSQAVLATFARAAILRWHLAASVLLSERTIVLRLRTLPVIADPVAIVKSIVLESSRAAKVVFRFLY